MACRPFSSELLEMLCPAMLLTFSPIELHDIGLEEGGELNIVGMWRG
jgi:hypothetical protein